ncbi:hypothetical protein D3C71_1182430 [compost metagenome]
MGDLLNREVVKEKKFNQYALTYSAIEVTIHDSESAMKRFSDKTKPNLATIVGVQSQDVEKGKFIGVAYSGEVYEIDKTHADFSDGVYRVKEAFGPFVEDEIIVLIYFFAEGMNEPVALYYNLTGLSCNCPKPVKRYLEEI